MFCIIASSSTQPLDVTGRQWLRHAESILRSTARGSTFITAASRTHSLLHLSGERTATREIESRSAAALRTADGTRPERPLTAIISGARVRASNAGQRIA